MILRRASRPTILEAAGGLRLWFRSQREAAEFLGTQPSCVSTAMKKNRTCFGFRVFSGWKKDL